MKKILVLARREWLNLFVTPLGWAVLAVAYGVLSYLFLAQLDDYLANQGRLAGLPNVPGATQLVVSQWFGNAATVATFLLPLISMRMVSEEWRRGTISLLWAAPLKNYEIVFGKYLALVGYCALLELVLLALPLSLLAGTELDLGLLAANALGFFLLMAAASAVGLFASTLTRHPAAAATIAYGILVLLWVVNWQAGADLHGQINWFAYLSLATRYQAMLRGVVDSADAAFFVVMAGLFLFLAMWQTRRLQRLL